MLIVKHAARDATPTEMATPLFMISLPVKDVTITDLRLSLGDDHRMSAADSSKHRKIS
jgi:hypothetical protein